MSIDAIGDFLTIIRNGLMASKSFVVIPHSKMRFEVGRILKEEGFIRDCLVEEVEGKASTRKYIKVLLKYVNGESVIHEITRISKPSSRFYSSIQSVKPVIGGLGISILTTSQGIVSNRQAEKLKVGGEVLCTVW